MALIGVAAAFIVMTASAGPAQALFGIGGQKPEAVPQRLTRMPESVYVQREELAEFVSVVGGGCCWSLLMFDRRCCCRLFGSEGAPLNVCSFESR